MSRFKIFNGGTLLRFGFIVLAGLGLVLAGCSDDSPTNLTQNNADPTTGVFHGEVPDNAPDFEIISTRNGDPENPLPGPFAIRGRNIHYDGEAGNLVVDLSVVNLGEETYNEPVTLTFLSLLPDGVTVANPDNDEHGAGAAIVFEFENDDAMWAPGEESLGRETRFVVDEGVSIGFVARLDTGSDTPTQGSIGGMVWNDENGDGIMDETEAGLAGAVLELSAEGLEPVETTSGEDGTYRFDDLDSGFYKVMKKPSDSMTPTTSPMIYVVLVEENGAVASFMAANFGCMEDDTGPTGIIKGKVWNDLNGDGVQDDGEPGLEGATLTLGGDATGTTTTASDGSYAFIELMAGTYAVTSTGPDGWVATTATEIQVVLATDDEVFNEASFGWREPVLDVGSIGGVVFEDLNGNKIQDDGEPGIADIGVTLSGGGTGTTTSGVDGTYSFADLTAGDYTVTCDPVTGFDSTTGTTLEIKLNPGDDLDNAVFGWWMPVGGAG